MMLTTAKNHWFKLLVVFLLLAYPFLMAPILGGGGGVPSGGIVLSNGACPSGFTELTAAQGRFIVGTPSGGTDAGTVGVAMTDLLATPVNLAAVTVPSTALTVAQLAAHTHSISVRAGDDALNTNVEATGLTGAANTLATLSAGSGSAHGHGTVDPDGGGHSMPYIQYRLCER